MHKNSKGPAATGRCKTSEKIGKPYLQESRMQGVVYLNTKVSFLCLVIPFLGIASKQYYILASWIPGAEVKCQC